MKLHFNAVPSSTYISAAYCRINWLKISVNFVCTLCRLLLQAGGDFCKCHASLSTILIWLPPNPQSICCCLQPCVIIKLTNPKNTLGFIPSPGFTSYSALTTQANGRSSCPTAVAVTKRQVTFNSLIQVTKTYILIYMLIIYTESYSALRVLYLHLTPSYWYFIFHPLLFNSRFFCTSPNLKAARYRHTNTWWNYSTDFVCLMVFLCL